MSLSESFYWHDYETSGAEVSLDRPLQFAGIRTDLDLNVIGEPLVIYNRLTPDCLPHPTAIRVTGISPMNTLADGLSENKFIHLIHDELSKPGTCGVGYNSIRFDDEITRFTLYRNFFEPYAREFGQGRSRWDLMDPARAIYALRPEGVIWPTGDEGFPSFRLEELSAANNIEHTHAHDALSDVYATIELARVLKAAQPTLFETLWSLRLKNRVAPFLSLEKMQPVIHVSGMFGAARNNLAVIVPLAEHPVNRNEIICADLSVEPDFLLEDAEAVCSKLFARKEDLPDGCVRPPLKSVRINKAPVILSTEWLRGEVAERLGLDGRRHRESLAAIKGVKHANPEAFKAFIQSLYSDQSFAPRTDPDTQLYDGFFDRADTALFPEIRNASVDELRDQGWIFRDVRLPELLFRYRARNYPDSLTKSEQVAWQEHCRSKLLGLSGFNLDAFKTEMVEQRALLNLSSAQIMALDHLESYVEKLKGDLDIAD